MNLVRKEDFGCRKISTVKVSDAKQWFAKLQKDGRGFSTISSVRGVIKPAFQMAYDEDAVRKNPFVFKLTDVVVNDTVPRAALTEEHLGIWMNFIERDNTYHKYYDEFVVLLETGMRVSEFCGLTRKDLDFKNRRIRVDHQLIRERGGKYYVEETKTSSGRRFLPMNETVYPNYPRRGGACARFAPPVWHFLRGRFHHPDGGAQMSSKRVCLMEYAGHPEQEMAAVAAPCWSGYAVPSILAALDPP